MNYIKVLLSVTCLTCLFGCKAVDTPRSFTIGKGGGFTGKYDTYLVKSDGLVYKTNEGQADELIKKIDKKQIALIFKHFDQLNIIEDKFSHPGNMTSFIRYTVDSKSYEIKWGSTNAVPPQKYADFFDEVWKLIREK